MLMDLTELHAETEMVQEKLRKYLVQFMFTV